MMIYLRREHSTSKIRQNRRERSRVTTAVTVAVAVAEVVCMTVQVLIRTNIIRYLRRFTSFIV